MKEKYKLNKLIWTGELVENTTVGGRDAVPQAVFKYNLGDDNELYVCDSQGKLSLVRKGASHISA